MPSENIPDVADQATVDYFDGHAHHYSADRVQGVADLIRPHVPADASICDVGAGGGETLERIAEQLSLTDLTAMDISSVSIQRAADRLPNARTAVVSVLDDDSLTPWQGQFDVVLMAAVLHHLVRNSRRASEADARKGLAGAMSLAKPGGLVLLLEPAFRPRGVCGALFWVKRAVTKVTTSRVPIFGYWNNIGAPVVSFYTPKQLRQMISDAGGTIIAESAEVKSLGYADVLIRKANLALLIRVPK